MSQPDLVDERYYEVVRPHSFAERVTIVARDRIYDDFLRLMQPRAGETILDVGASDVLNDAANLLERRYPHPEAITAIGLGEAQAFQAAFPAVAYRRVTANAPLPFADKCFDVATSNAVLEHVGSHANQAFFVSELQRVAKRVFITVPHKYFPVEHHTGIPVLHFWRPSFGVACRMLGKSEWLDRSNLILMGASHLSSLAPRGLDIRTGATGLMLGPFSSNLFLAIQPPA